MRIGVDARELCGEPAGKGQYLRRVIQRWLRTPDVSLVLYVPTGASLPADLQLPASNAQAIAVGGWGPFWHRAVARRLRADRVDVFFAALSYQSALWNSVPTVTVVHDLAVFRVPEIVHSRRARFVERITLRLTTRRSARLIAVSQSTKNDLVSLTRLDPDRVTVLFEAAASNDVPGPLPLGEREPYFLFVGTLEPRKNIGRLLRAYAALPESIRARYALKLVGKRGWGEDYQALARRLGLDGRAQFLGYMPHDRLLALYRKATLFIYPSLYEGFGLPVIEAMSTGTPVITTNCSSLPEVVGEQGLMCDPTDERCLATTMASLVENPELWEKQSRYLSARARKFDWSEIAVAVLAVLSSASTTKHLPTTQPGR